MSIPPEYVEAGRIARETLKLSLELVEEGALLIDIAEKLEGYILSRGARPAFPVNISINEVAAHYSPSVSDESRIPPGSVVKVDVGVHVDGYIVDAALTIPLDRRWAPLAEAAREALRAALLTLRNNSPVNDVAKSISTSIESRGYKPVRNLTGHMVSRYVLHAGKSIPNVPDSALSRARVFSGEAYAVEPFATTGEGYVVERGESHIYRVTSTKKLQGDPGLNEYLELLWREYKGLPFSERWLERLGITLKDLHQLVKARRVYHYPRLVEVTGSPVSQFEDTVIILEGGCKALADVLSL